MQALTLMGLRSCDQQRRVNAGCYAHKFAARTDLSPSLCSQVRSKKDQGPSLCSLTLSSHADQHDMLTSSQQEGSWSFSMLDNSPFSETTGLALAAAPKMNRVELVRYLLDQARGIDDIALAHTEHIARIRRHSMVLELLTFSK